ncbi:hypothetical protein J6590_062976 [Homalodisca vitripennis]|nr:hypothetical protein J6590_062976 [Homalodisca vitripennis]
MGLFHRRILQERPNKSAEISSQSSGIIVVTGTRSQYSKSTIGAMSLRNTLKNKDPRCDLETLSSSRKPIRKVPSKSDYKTSLSKISSHQCVISE